MVPVDLLQAFEWANVITAATAIIQMPFKPFVPETYASREDITGTRFEDVVFHFHASDEMELSRKKRKSGPVGISQVYKDKKANDLLGKKALPYRTFNPYMQPPRTVKSEAVSRDEDNKSEIKRRFSFVSGAQDQIEVDPSPTPVTSEPTTDAEYEVVAGPAPVEEASDSDSDCSTLVEVKYEDLVDVPARELPIRSREQGAAATAGAAEPAESDSESDWTLV